nr:helix-turn-helix domain-containing protein [uncultured Blautia sp.]
MQETVYSVSEAVKVLEIKSHVLRYWEDEMKIPVQRNEMGHRYYTRYDIQVFLSINELKKKGYSLKEIGKLISLFYPVPVEKKELKDYKILKEKNKKKTGGWEKYGLPSEFMEVVSKIVLERMKEENSEEARYKRFDERIRNYQQTRREVAAAEEKGKAKKNSRKEKSFHNGNTRTYEKNPSQ